MCRFAIARFFFHSYYHINSQKILYGRYFLLCRWGTFIEGWENLVSREVWLPECHGLSGIHAPFWFLSHLSSCLLLFLKKLLFLNYSLLCHFAVFNIWEGSYFGWGDSAYWEGWMCISRNDHSPSTLFNSKPEEGLYVLLISNDSFKYETPLWKSLLSL